MKYMGQVMAECDCSHPACEARGYCMADRIDRQEAYRESEQEKFFKTLREVLVGLVVGLGFGSVAILLFFLFFVS